MGIFDSDWHRRALEGKAALFAGLTTVAIAIGGMVEIIPLYSATLGPEKLEGVTPYSPLEVAGRDIYVREGCYNCHSQMVRPFRSETLRYGPWSRAGEAIYDHPFQLGSRRIGPDLARVGGKYPDAWHYEHMRDPRSLVAESIMPAYPWLFEQVVDPADIQASMTALQTVGVPYSDAEISGAPDAIAAQEKQIVDSLATAKITAAPDTEIVALIAYLQRIGRDGQASIAKSEEAAKAAGGTP